MSKPSSATVFDIGLGITSRCNAACSHCYSTEIRGYHDMLFEQVVKLTQCMNINSVNLGTGEPGMHPNFDRIISYLIQQVPKVSITSNGVTLARMTDEQLLCLHDVDVSLDYPDRTRHDAHRGARLYDRAIAQLERCRELGVRSSIATVAMAPNLPFLTDLLNQARRYGAAMRINLYKQTGQTDLNPSYADFWAAFKSFFREALIVSCSEPIFCSVLGIDGVEPESPCCHSLRIRPDGGVGRCVYLEGQENIFSLNNDEIASRLMHLHHPSLLPVECISCPDNRKCHGGCEARRVLTDGLGRPDRYCPRLREEDLQIAPKWEHRESGENYVHSKYLCTLIVE